MTAVSNGIPLPNNNRDWMARTAMGPNTRLKTVGTANLRVLFASPEVFPLAKTGGLADVSAALPATLAGLGADMRLVLPAYTEALDRARNKSKPIPLGDILGLGEIRLIPARTPDTDLPLWLVDCPSLYRGAAAYISTQRDGIGRTTRSVLLRSPTP